MAEFEREGWPNHVIAALIDHDFGGLLREVFSGPDPAALREGWTRETGMETVELSVQDYVDRVSDALELAEATEHPTHEPEEADARLLLRARLRDLPRARPIEPPELTSEEQEALVRAFETSDHGAPLGDDADLATHFVAMAAATAAIDPLRWTPMLVDQCLLDWLPSKITLGDEDQARVPDVLRAWIRYAGESRGRPAEAIEDTVAAVDELEADYRAAMKDRTPFGPAKSVISAMLEEGVPLTDQASLDAWLADFNARPQAERDRVLGHLRAPDGSGPGIDGTRA